MGAVSFTLTSKVGPYRVELSATMSDEHVPAPTYIIGNRGNILEAGEEADLVRTGIFIGYTELMLELTKLRGSREVLTMGTCTRPGQLSAQLDRI